MTQSPVKELPVREESRQDPPLRLGVEVAVVGLFVLALVGVWLLAGARHADMPSWHYYSLIALAVVPLLLLAVALAFEIRVTEGLRLRALYQGRIDQLQNRLFQRENMLRLVSDHQAGAITIFDRHNRYWFVNERAAASLGKDPLHIVGQPPIKILSNDKAKTLEIKLAEARASDEPMEIVERVTDEHGKTKFIQRSYEAVTGLADMNGCVLLREEDLTNLIVERERREQMFRQVIETLVAVVDRRDPYAAGHSSRVGQLAKAVAIEMGLSTTEVEASEIAGSLMNFGKVLVSRRILTKTGPLTPEELQRVRESILTSADILAIIGFEGPVVPTLRQVLERYDGSGVPEGLKGEDIMITARIVAVANAFVAFVSPRAHREGLPFREALAVMAQETGKAFDERVLVALTHYVENRPRKLDWLMGGKKALG